MTNHIYTIGASGSAKSAAIEFNAFIQEWIDDMLEDCKVVSIISSSTTGEAGNQWIMTIIYQYSTIVKREMLIERIIKEIPVDVPEGQVGNNNGVFYNEGIFNNMMEYDLGDDDW